MAAPRAAVVGAGHCGTGYTAALLTANGHKTGHEEWFRPLPGRNPALDVDVSWLALPDIEQGFWSGPVAHVIRNPIRSIPSLAYFFGETQVGAAFPAFARHNCHEIRDLYGVEAAVEWWVAWNRRCADIASVTLRIEDLDKPWAVAELGAALGVALEPRPVSKRTNHHEDRAAAPAEKVRALLRGRAKEFGY